MEFGPKQGMMIRAEAVKKEQEVTLRLQYSCVGPSEKTVGAPWTRHSVRPFERTQMAVRMSQGKTTVNTVEGGSGHSTWGDVWCYG